MSEKRMKTQSLTGSDVDSLMLKIETQKTDEPNPFSGQRDEREKAQIKQRHSNNELKISRANHTKVVSVIVMLLLYSVYYSLIAKVNNNEYTVKVYHSLSMMIVYLIDKLFETEPNKLNKLNISDEEDELKESLIQPKQPKIKLSLKEATIIVILYGIIIFISELLTFKYIRIMKGSNIGLYFSFLCFELIMIRIYYKIKYNLELEFINQVGILVQVIFIMSILIYSYHLKILLYAISLSLLRFSRIILRLLLNTQTHLVIMKYAISADFTCGCLLFGILLFTGNFSIHHFTNAVITFFASGCCYFYIKNRSINTVFDFTIFSFIYPFIGIVDLLINEHLIYVSSFVIMLITALTSYLYFKGNKINIVN